MRRPILASLLCLPLFLLASCETPPTPQEVKSAHYGHYPSDYRSATRNLLEDRHQQLGDPFNVISVSTPQKDYTGDAGDRKWGYSSVIVYNAPNQAVGATVYQYREKVFFHNGQVVEVKNVANAGDLVTSIVANNLAGLQAGLQGDDQGGGGDDGAGGDDGSGGADDGSGGTTVSSGGHRSRHTAGRSGVTAARHQTRTTAVRKGPVVAKPARTVVAKPAPVQKKK